MHKMVKSIESALQLAYSTNLCPLLSFTMLYYYFIHFSHLAMIV